MDDAEDRAEDAGGGRAADAADGADSDVAANGHGDADGGSVDVQRARIEQIRPLASEYKREQESLFGAPTDPPLPQGGVFWIATDRSTGETLGYAAGSLRPTGCTIGPVFTRSQARRRGVGEALVSAIQRWAADTRVPVVEISVAADNDAGRRFLEALGYEPRRVLMSLTPTTARSEQRA